MGSYDGEVRRLCEGIIEQIEKQSDLPRAVLKDDVEFRVITDSTWKVPREGEETKVRLGLWFTNRSIRKTQFYLFETIHVFLLNSQGEMVKREGGQLNPFKGLPTMSPVVEPADDYTFMYSDAKLCWRNKDLQLIYVDRGAAEHRCFTGLSTGKYYVGFLYGTQMALPSIDGVSVWGGKITTNLFEIEIK